LIKHGLGAAHHFDPLGQLFKVHANRKILQPRCCQHYRADGIISSDFGHALFE